MKFRCKRVKSFASIKNINMNKEIENLLPHRYPFIFVDEIISADKEKVLGTKTFDKEKDKMLTGSFPDYEYIPGMIIIESMAQCGGAGVKYAKLAEGFFGLAAMTDVKFLKGVKFGDKIRYEIENLLVSNRLIKQKGVAYCNKIPIAEATWTVGRIDKK